LLEVSHILLKNKDALASSLLVLAPIVGKKGTSENILPIFLTLLKDPDSDVRITLFKKLSLLTKVFYEKII
jgi:serine/threonine-protein phosphatase 2A regulatory subunit A